MITHITDQLGQAVVSGRIGGSEAAGWYALHDMNLMRWGRDGNIAETALQWPDYPLNVEDSEHALLGDTFVVGGRRQNSTGPSRIRFGEFDAATGALRTTYENGNGQSRWGGGCPTNKGGFVAAFWVDVLPKTTIVLDIFYRRPPMPPIPGTTTPPQWLYERRSFTTTSQSGIYDYLQVVQGPDGLIWIFVMRDSAGTIALLRYRPTASGLEFVDEDPDFIPRGLGQLSPSGESPNLGAVVDRRNNRIVLCYQGAPDGGTANYSECLKAKYANGFSSYWSVTEVGMDKRTRLIGTTPWWSAHAGDELPGIVARRDGIYFWLTHTTPADCSDEGMRVGRLVNGVFEIGATVPRGSLLAASPDGWFFYLDRTAQPYQATYLAKLRCRPEMSIRDDGDNVVVDWDEADVTDVLQHSANVEFSIVDEFYGAGLPPRIIPKTCDRFFRVRPIY